MEKEYSVDEKNLLSATKLEPVGGKVVTSVGNTPSLLCFAPFGCSVVC